MTRTPVGQGWRVERRSFLKTSALALAGLSSCAEAGAADQTDTAVRLRLGLVADPHYADVPPKGARFYRESLVKMQECVDAMNRENVDLLVALGDVKDQNAQAEEAASIGYLQAMESVLQGFQGPRYHVLGNHDLDSISKAQFAAAAPSTGIPSAQSYYSFDAGQIHLVVLDANFRGDGQPYDHGNFDWTDTWIPPQQLDWLKQDLETTRLPVVVFVHQLLDKDTDFCVKNAEEVRRVLEGSGHVLVVFHGHNHAGNYSCIEGIHYYTLRAMVEGSGEENSAYATADILANGGVVVTGYRRALSRIMKPTPLPSNDNVA